MVKIADLGKKKQFGGLVITQRGELALANEYFVKLSKETPLL